MEWNELWTAVWKSLVVFALLMGLSRAVGRKLLGQMSYFDFVVSITIGTLGATYISQAVKGHWVLVGPVVLSLAAILFEFAFVKSLQLRKIVQGEPVVVMQNGKVLEKNMKKLRYNLNQLEMQLRVAGVFDFAEVEFAILESFGQLSVLKKSQNLPLTPQDLNLITKYKGFSAEIIKDGKILEQNLVQNNLNRAWLLEELKKHEVRDVSEVLYAALNTQGELYVSVRDGDLKYVQEIED